MGRAIYLIVLFPIIAGSSVVVGFALQILTHLDWITAAFATVFTVACTPLIIRGSRGESILSEDY